MAEMKKVRNALAAGLVEFGLNPRVAAALAFCSKTDAMVPALLENPGLVPEMAKKVGAEFSAEFGN